MKVIFLDFDGVLNSLPTLEIYFKKHKDNDCVVPEMIERVNKIVDATGAKVVISSTWRLLFDLETLRDKYLKANGFRGEVIDITPDYGRVTMWSRRGGRGSEIQAWLDDHTEVTSFVILDDDDDMAHLSHRLVKTTWLVGIEDEHVTEAIKLLNEGD